MKMTLVLLVAPQLQLMLLLLPLLLVLPRLWPTMAVMVATVRRCLRAQLSQWGQGLWSRTRWLW